MTRREHPQNFSQAAVLYPLYLYYPLIAASEPDLSCKALLALYPYRLTVWMRLGRALGADEVARATSPFYPACPPCLRGWIAPWLGHRRRPPPKGA